MIWLASIWARFIAFVPQMIDVIMKHWEKFLVLTMACIIYNQNFMEFQAFRIFGIETIPHIKQDMREVEDKLAACEKRELVLETKVATVNTQINKWADVSGQLQKYHNDLYDEIVKMRVNSEQAVTDILAGPTPQTCEDAIQYLRDSVKTGGDIK